MYAKAICIKKNCGWPARNSNSMESRSNLHFCTLINKTIAGKNATYGNKIGQFPANTITHPDNEYISAPKKEYVFPKLSIVKNLYIKTAPRLTWKKYSSINMSVKSLNPENETIR